MSCAGNDIWIHICLTSPDPQPLNWCLHLSRRSTDWVTGISTSALAPGSHRFFLGGQGMAGPGQAVHHQESSGILSVFDFSTDLIIWESQVHLTAGKLSLTLVVGWIILHCKIRPHLNPQNLWILCMAEEALKIRYTELEMGSSWIIQVSQSNYETFKAQNTFPTGSEKKQRHVTQERFNCHCWLWWRREGLQAKGCNHFQNHRTGRDPIGPTSRN